VLRDPDAVETKAGERHRMHHPIAALSIHFVPQLHREAMIIPLRLPDNQFNRA
jgi:hypothetical protein